MRHEIQHWDQIRATVEIIVAGVGQTGLVPTVAIQRVSDGQWLANGGGSWSAAYATNNMIAVDATNLPGLYSYAVPSAALTYTQGLAGYRLKIAESTNALLEHVKVVGSRSEWDELATSHSTTGSMGRTLRTIQGLVQGNHRLKSPVFDTGGRMTSCSLVVYPTSADALADTNALETFTVTCTYDAFGNLSSLLSRN